MLLQWSTLSEVNNYGFTVQRGGERDGTFSTLPNAFLPGYGTTNEPRYYSFRDSTAGNGLWFYRLLQIDLDGEVHSTDAIQVSIVTGVAEFMQPHFALFQNFPNPFNPTTQIMYSVPPSVSGSAPSPSERDLLSTSGRDGQLLAPSRVEGSVVSVRVFDLLGREVATLVNEKREPGTYQVTWNAAGFPSGTYFCRLTAGSYTDTKKVVLLR